MTWHPSGKGFTVLDKVRLAKEVLPMYFKEAKFSSFNRRLKRWNFCIQRHGHKMSSYFHPKFIRGDVRSILKICPSAAQKPYHPALEEESPVSKNLGVAGETKATSSRGCSSSNGKKRSHSSGDNENGNEPSVAAVVVGRTAMERREQQEDERTFAQYRSFRLQQPHRQKVASIPVKKKNSSMQMIFAVPGQQDATTDSAMPPFLYQKQQPAIQEPPPYHGASSAVPSISAPSLHNNDSSQIFCDNHYPAAAAATRSGISLSNPCSTSSSTRLSMQHLYQTQYANNSGSSHIIMIPSSSNNGTHWPYFSPSATSYPSSIFFEGSSNVTNLSSSFNRQQFQHQQQSMPGSFVRTHTAPAGGNPFPIYAPAPSIQSSEIVFVGNPHHASVYQHPVGGVPITVGYCNPSSPTSMMHHTRNDLLVFPSSYHQS
mmetsp:Transcript_15463/g.29175  ORF Transcript_15463/g.29175 Transcript_15463/m.29175 type:complete len:429 (+) Transcript_15463:162-1448(+)